MWHLLLALCSVSAARRTRPPPEPAPVVCEGDRDLETAEQLTAFRAEACTELVGKLSLSRLSLEAAAPLPLVRASALSIYKAPGLRDLSLFPALASLDELSLRANPDLLSLEGPAALVVSVEIDLYENPTLESLAGLEHVHTVHSLGVLSNDALRGLAGLDQLHAADEIYLSGGAIESLRGLERITELDALHVSFTTQLEELGPLSSLRRADSVQLTHNEGLRSLRGLEGIETLRQLEVKYNPVLEDLEGLDGLRVVDEISIFRNEGLLSLAGLHNLETTRELEIEESLLLSDLSALANLRTVRRLTLDTLGLTDVTGLKVDHIDVLEIIGNQQLVSLHGLEGVRSVRWLEIAGNHNLPSLDGLGITSPMRKIILSSDFALTDASALDSVPGIVEVDIASHNGLPASERLRISSKVTGGTWSFEPSPAASAVSKSAPVPGAPEKICSGVVRIHDAVALEAFRARRCTRLEGSLIIREAGLVRLGPLDLRHVDALVIRGLDGLEDLRGLELLETVGELELSTNGPALTRLDGLENLRHAGSIDLERNLELASLEGLSGLQHVDGTFDLNAANGLEDLDGLQALQSTQELLIRWCDRLVDLSALTSLEPGTSVHFFENDALPELAEIELLERLHPAAQAH